MLHVNLLLQIKQERDSILKRHFKYGYNVAFQRQTWSGELRQTTFEPIS